MLSLLWQRPSSRAVERTITTKSSTAPRWFLNRLFELVMCGVLISLGIHMLAFPRAIEASAFRFILDVVGGTALTCAYLLVGWFRVMALLANGSVPIWGPRLRMVGAMIGAAIWMQMCIALINIAPQVGVPSPGIWVYLWLFIGELAATYMAAADDRSRIL